MTDDRPRRTGRARLALAPCLGAVLIVATLLGAPSVAPGQEDDTSGAASIDEDALRAEYEDLAGEEADLLVQYDVSQARLVELTGQVAEAGVAQERAEQALTEAEDTLTERRAAEETADEALVAARARVAEAEDEVRRFAVGAFVGEGAQEDLASLMQLLDGEDGSAARRGYISSFDDQQRQLIDDLVTARAESARLQRQARTATRRAARTRDDVDALRVAATDALAEASRLAHAAADERDRQAGLILDIQSRRVSLEARIVSLDRAADGVAEVLASFQARDPDWVAGSLDVQSPMPCTPISSEFGMRSHPILGYTRLHAGADMGASTGEAVHAAADGIVLLAEVRGGYGNTVVIAHASSLGTVYAHNSEMLVQPGQQVRRGEVIARAGSTGLSTGPHVHFETRIKGVPVDPRNFLLPIEGGTGVPGPVAPPEPDRPGLSTTTTTTEPIGQC